MDRDDLLRAYEDVVSHGNEHHDYAPVEAALGLDSDEFQALLAKLAAAIERDFTDAETPWWPPTTQVDRASGLQGAFRLGVLTALKAAQNERKDVPYA